ncbi:unnamed protein product, partial [Allacma fusca]
ESRSLKVLIQFPLQYNWKGPTRSKLDEFERSPQLF